MSDTEQKLTRADVELLTNSSDEKSKEQLVRKVAGNYSSSNFSESETKLAEEIFRLLVKYSEIGVRKAIADNLMTAENLPKDILMTLARDVDDVSRPILEFSDLLTSEDLISLIKTTDSDDKQLAISRRDSLPDDVSSALVETKKDNVIASLLSNETASIKESDYQKILDLHSNKEEVIESLITRGSIPSSVVLSITNKVSDAIKAKLEKKYETSFSSINGLFKESGEIAAFRFGNMKIFGDDLLDLVSMLESNQQLEKALDPLHGKLTFVLNDFEPIGKFVPISAVAIGHKTMFEVCVSRISGIKYNNVEKLVNDLDHGLKALYERVNLPDALFEAVRFSLWVIKKMDEEAEKFGSKKAQDDLHEYIRRLITLSRGKKIKNLSSFISIIKKHIQSQGGDW